MAVIDIDNVYMHVTGLIRKVLVVADWTKIAPCHNQILSTLVTI